MLIFRLAVLSFSPVDTQVLFFAFCREIWIIRWMNRHPVSLRGCQTSFLMVCHAILRQILNSSRELSVYVFFILFQLCAQVVYMGMLPPSLMVFLEKLSWNIYLGSQKCIRLSKATKRLSFHLHLPPPRSPSQCCLPVDWLGYRRLGSIIFINQTDAPRTSVLTHPSSCWHLC